MQFLEDNSDIVWGSSKKPTEVKNFHLGNNIFYNSIGLFQNRKSICEECGYTIIKYKDLKGEKEMGEHIRDSRAINYKEEYERLVKENEKLRQLAKAQSELMYL
jgi:hypothetical protein